MAGCNGEMEIFIRKGLRIPTKLPTTCNLGNGGCLSVELNLALPKNGIMLLRKIGGSDHTPYFKVDSLALSSSRPAKNPKTTTEDPAAKITLNFYNVILSTYKL